MVGPFCCSSAKDRNGLVLFLILPKGSCPLGRHTIHPFFLFTLGPSRGLAAGGVRRRIWPRSAAGAQHRICFKFFPSSLLPLLVLKSSQMLRGREKNLKKISIRNLKKTVLLSGSTHWRCRWPFFFVTAVSARPVIILFTLNTAFAEPRGCA